MEDTDHIFLLKQKCQYRGNKGLNTGETKGLLENIELFI